MPSMPSRYATDKAFEAGETKFKAAVTKRADPCTCGCGGRDPWHQATYERVLRDVRRVDGSAHTYGAGRVKYDAIATVQAPWGVDEAVRVYVLLDEGLSTERRFSTGWWFVAGY